MSIPGSGSKPLDIGTPAIEQYSGQDKDERIGSSGNFKGTKTSALNKVKKLLQPAEHSRHEAKRANQKSIAERRIENLTQAPRSKDVANALDSASYSLQPSTAKSSSPQILTLSLKEDPVIEALQKISDLEQQVKTAPKERHALADDGKKPLAALTAKGAKDRVQADCTVLLTNTIRRARCPKSLCHLQGTLATASDQGLISKKQQKKLQHELDTQTTRHLKAFVASIGPRGATTREGKREEIKQHLLELKELVVTVRTVNRDLLKEKSLDPNNNNRAVLNGIALELQQASASLVKPADSLRATEERLHASYDLLETHVRPVLEQSLTPPDITEEIIVDARNNTLGTQREVQRKLQEVVATREQIGKHQDIIAKADQLITGLEEDAVELKKEIATAKGQLESLRSGGILKRRKAKKALAKLEKQETQLTQKLTSAQQEKAKSSTLLSFNQARFDSAQFTDKDSFSTSKYEAPTTLSDSPQKRSLTASSEQLERDKSSLQQLEKRTEAVKAKLSDTVEELKGVQQQIESSSSKKRKLALTSTQKQLEAQVTEQKATLEKLHQTVTARKASLPSRMLSVSLQEADSCRFIQVPEYQKLESHVQTLLEEYPELDKSALAKLISYSVDRMNEGDHAKGSFWYFSEVFSAFESACNSLANGESYETAQVEANSVLEDFSLSAEASKHFVSSDDDSFDWESRGNSDNE